jgi:hypothetical protein
MEAATTEKLNSSIPEQETNMLESTLSNLEAPLGIGAAYLGPARVLELNDADQLVLVELTRAGETSRGWARPALGHQSKIRSGDSVLVISHDMADFYVIGWLARQPTAAIAALSTKAGAGVAVEEIDGEEVVRVHSRRGELVLEYHPESGRTLVNIENGDLEFMARQGSISFHSAQDIRFGARAINLLSRWGTQLGVMDAGGEVTSALKLDAKRLQTISPELKVAAQQADIRIKDAEYRGEDLSAEVGAVKMTARRIEVLAECVIEKAKNVYRTVEELLQSRAGRMRTLVRGFCHLKARKAFFKTDEEFKVDGEKIHLG